LTHRKNRLQSLPSRKNGQLGFSLHRARTCCRFQDEFSECTGDKIQHWFGQAWINANPKHVVHNEIRVGQIANHAVFAVLVGRLAKQIAAEQQPRRNLVCFESVDQSVTAEGRIETNANWKTKPGWV
jgi:hypothetical protein